jgi:hypothetical protein
MDKLWIYDEDGRKLRQVDAAKVSRGAFAPEHKTRWTYWRRGKKTKWKFVFCGSTAEECCERVNARSIARIAKLRAEIAALEKKLVEP